MRRTAFFAAATALAAVLVAAPAAADASTIYPPSNSCSTTPSTFVAGETVQFRCADGTFSADEQVTVTVTGENGAATTFAMVKLAVSTGSTVRQSTAGGALETVSITFPAGATGVYNIEAISPTSAGGAASASVVTEAGLAATGGDAAAATGLWIGGGALVLGGAALAVVTATRRARA